MKLTERPDLFTDLLSVVPDITLDLKYLGTDNFMGDPVEGYESNRCWITQPAASALKRVQKALASFGLGLKVFDAYRPQRSVNHFLRWSEVHEDVRHKTCYYPDLTKPELFEKGYLVKHSSHSRGSTVDLTVVSLTTGEELDMGTCFDFFGPLSWIDCQSISAQARANRMLLQSVMVQHGFVPFHHEWWHFTLQDEPYPDICFDFPIV
ncbi:MAG: M15 family metallopeptidase [Pontibacterium sp.]